jgi:hypothetical protein
MTSELTAKRQEIMADVRDRYEDALIIRRWQYARATLRRRNTAPKLRERLEQLVVELQQEAAGRSVELSGWRPYPRHDRPFVFTAGLDARGHQLREPEPERRRKPQSTKPPAKSAGDMLGDVEQQLAASIAALS